MERSESHLLQQEIEYWTKLISSHKQSVPGNHQPRAKNLNSKVHSTRYAWTKSSNNTRTNQFNQSLRDVKSLKNSDIPISNTNRSLRQIQSSGDFTASSNHTKFKWNKKTSSSSTISTANYVSKQYSSSLPTSASSSVVKHNATSVSTSTQQTLPRISQKSGKHVVSPKTITKSSQFKWSKTKQTSSSSTIDSLHTSVPQKLPIASSSLDSSAFLPTKTKSPKLPVNTRHRYRRRSSGSDSNSKSNASEMRKHILSKYKLLRVSQRRASGVNISTNPYKVIKGNATSPTRRHPRARRSNLRHINVYQNKPPHHYSRYGKHYNTSQTGNYKSNKTSHGNNRYKLVRTNVQTRSRKSGNIVLRRKQMPSVNTAVSQHKLTIHSPTVKQRLASRVLHRSKETMRFKNTHRLRKVFCIFYNRFGRCNRGEKCQFTHDPDRVAVCSKFLRGTCHDDACPFSHKISKQKMPVCSFFLRGKCSAKECPYLHVFVGRDAPVCKAFANHGYCPKADNCKEQHVRICPEFYEKGKCVRGEKCNLPHKKKIKREKRRHAARTAHFQTSQAGRSNHANEDGGSNEGSGFIRLPKTSKEETTTNSTVAVASELQSTVRIQPRLKLRKLPKSE